MINFNYTVTITDDTDTLNEAVQWCQKTFGANGGVWLVKDGRYPINEIPFHFALEKHAFLFRLRWAC